MLKQVGRVSRPRSARLPLNLAGIAETASTVRSRSSARVTGAPPRGRQLPGGVYSPDPGPGPSPRARGSGGLAGGRCLRSGRCSRGFTLQIVGIRSDVRPDSPSATSITGSQAIHQVAVVCRHASACQIPAQRLLETLACGNVEMVRRLVEQQVVGRSSSLASATHYARHRKRGHRFRTGPRRWNRNRPSRSRTAWINQLASAAW